MVGALIDRAVVERRGDFEDGRKILLTPRDVDSQAMHQQWGIWTTQIMLVFSFALIQTEFGQITMVAPQLERLAWSI